MMRGADRKRSGVRDPACLRWQETVAGGERKKDGKKRW